MAMYTKFRCIATRLASRLFSPAGRATSSTPTFNCTARTSLHVQIVAGQRMSRNAMSLLGVLSRNTNAAKNIHGSRNVVQMNWIDARTNSAQVVAIQSWIDRSDKERVHQAMDDESVIFPDVHHRIPAFRRLIPNPARSFISSVFNRDATKNAGENLRRDFNAVIVTVSHIGSTIVNVMKVGVSLIHLRRPISVYMFTF